jgi:hypothetical protein
MTDDEFTNYREGRYVEALNYYDNKAIWNKRLYHICSIYVLIVSAGISPIVLLCKERGQILTAILSPTITVLAAIAGHYRFHENWLGYRATWDALRHQIYWHGAKAGLYAGQEDPNRFFVEQVEDLISREGSEWLRRHAPKERGDASGTVQAG